MSADRELLERAAKAAGMKLEQGYGQPPEKCLFYMDREGRCHDWNPIDDDGDALRLAVKLKLEIGWEPNEDTVWCEMAGETFDGDPYAATRRAIVRAAAEIGKGKP